MFQIDYTPRAEREYHKLPAEIQEEVKGAMIPALQSGPFRHPIRKIIKKFKGKLKDQYRFRLSPSWRCMYRVEGNRVILLYFYFKG